MKKCISLSLALILAALSLLSCSDNGGEETKSASSETVHQSASNTESESETEAEKTVTDTVREKYSSYSYDGYEYKVLAPGPNAHFAYNEVGTDVNEVWVEESDGTPLNDALFARNLATEDLLGIKVTPIFADNDEIIRNQVQTEVTAGTTDYDTVLNRMDYIGPQAESGLYLNLMDHLDTSNPWWDKNIVDAFTLWNSKLYWISGDINVYDDFAVEVLFANKTILEENGFGLPYQDVLEGKWTIERMYEMAKACEKDVDGNGKMVVGKDIVGHIECNDHIKHWIYAMGEKSCDIDSEGNLEVNILTESHISAVDTLFNYMVEKQMTYTANWDQFFKGTVVFCGNMLGPINSLREMEDDFGVIPMAKKNEEQENYGHYVSNGWTTAYAVPMTNKDPDRTGIILEVLCGFSTDTVRSALYDVLFAAKLVRDTESVEMLNIIFDTKSYDWAVDFSWGGNFANLYNGIYNTKNNTYVSGATKSQKIINKMLDKVITDFKALEY